MRRHHWLWALVLAGCSNDTVEDSLVQQTTRVRVTPEAFLGNLACRDEGGVQMYQATLIDITEGVDQPFRLPSSRVVNCFSDIYFDYVKAGRRYMAEITAFDQRDLKNQNPGSPVIIDESNKSVAARWTTTCWGDDRLDYSSYQMGMGGAAPEDAKMGGTGGVPDAGLIAHDKTTTTLRGCEPLVSDQPPTPTGASLDIEAALIGLQCGSEAGQVERFALSAPPTGPLAMGGAGGAAPLPPEQSAPCGEAIVATGLEPDQHLGFDIDLFEAGKATASWTTRCWALTVEGAIVPSRCDPVTGEPASDL